MILKTIKVSFQFACHMTIYVNFFTALPVSLKASALSHQIIMFAMLHLQIELISNSVPNNGSLTIFSHIEPISFSETLDIILAQS